MHPPVRPAAQAASPASGPSPWVVLAVVLGGLAGFEAVRAWARSRA